MIRALTCVLILAVSSVPADEHQHHAAQPAVERPKIFLDKSPRVVEYQLKRLDNTRLLLVERDTTDPKYSPVYQAILIRPGISRKDRDESLNALCTIRKSDPVTQLLDAIAPLDATVRDQKQVGRQLGEMLLQRPATELQMQKSRLQMAAQAMGSIESTVGFAALIVAGESDAAWQAATASADAQVAWLDSVALIPVPTTRQSLRPRIAELLTSGQTRSIRNAAIRALGTIASQQAETFSLVAPLVSDSALREAAVRTLLLVPAADRSESNSRSVLSELLKFAEQTPVAERTTDAFVDAMQLADQLLSRLPSAESIPLRLKLRELAVRVIRVRTIHEEMRYDTPFFAVEAGQSVQLVLANDDLMPHNLVLVQPGQLQEVATIGAELGPATGHPGLPYVPAMDAVLFATGMVEAGRVERLTFTAPATPGEYPYVCTFPRHWMRMYGVMLVVPDLDSWQRNPVPPKDPLGNNRSFVQSWKPDDFTGDLSADLHGRSTEIGARLFREATCLQCHKVGTEGGVVGPALHDVMTRWKGDRHGILREILDPSYKIDPKYVVQVVLTTDGKSQSGIIKAEDDKSISLLINPEAPSPVVIPRSDIDEIIPTSTSMMPRALLDKFTRDELLEILNYLCVAADAAGTANP